MSNNYKSKKQSHYLLLPIILTLVVVPLVSRIYSYDPKLSSYAWFPNETTTYDFFLFYRSIVFIILSAFMCGYIIYKAIQEKKQMKFAPIFIPLGIYAILCLLSSIFSDYISTCFRGGYDRFESILVVLGYCLTAYYTYLCINTEETVKKIIHWWMIALVILCLLGLSQAFSYDFYQTPLGHALIAGGVNLKFNFEPGRVYMSLFNPNYVGPFVALTFPIVFILTFHKKKMGEIIFFLLLCAGLLFCLLGSQSRNGILSLGIALFVLLLLYRKELLKRWKIALPIFLVFIGVLFLFNLLNKNVLINRITSMFHSSAEAPPLSEIDTTNQTIKITYNNELLFAEYSIGESNPLSLKDKNGEPISFLAEEDTTIFPDNPSITYHVTDERFPNFTFTVVASDETNTSYVIQINTNGSIWNIIKQVGNDDYYFYNNLEKFDFLRPIKSALPPEFESFGSGRGYIWSRSLPLLKDSLLLGSGQDTFTLVFPQDDYVGKENNGYTNVFITKPHNTYLLTAIQTGIPSLIALLLFYFIYLIGSIRIYWNCNRTSFLTQVGTGIFIGSIGYLISGFANDSDIAYSTSFWVFIGMGIAINQMVKKQIKEQ